MRAIQEDLAKEREKQLAQKNKLEQQKEDEEKKKAKEEQKKRIQTLSFKFDDDDEEEEEEEEFVPKKSAANLDTEKCDDGSQDVQVKKEDEDSNDGKRGVGSATDAQAKKMKITKNPDVDTSFLPDRNREEEERQLREQLRLEWVQKTEKMKNEDVEITFSYWDGSGHRRSVVMKKRNTIYQFLLKALELLRVEFHELKVMTADNLMYVKEDLIIPHHYTFYDFIVTKARGKSGPLFNFDVHDDVRLMSDVTLEKDESHAGKVLLRSWYERNKHIFPASRWEPYDPNKKYEKYTIKDQKT